MPDARPFSYLLLRLVPCLERGEAVNVGLCLFCRQYDFLELRTSVESKRLAAVAPDLDLGAVSERLATLEAVVSGSPAAGTLARMSPSERFGWLAAPSSTMIQASEVHAGLTDDPARELQRLFESLVL